MNKCIIVGRLTKEPELKRTSTDIPYVQFTLAVNRKFQNKQSGERQADFINCVAWRQSAELLARYVHKGNQIGVEGSIQTRNYQDQMGQTHYVTEVAVESISFLEPKSAQQNYMGANPFGDFNQMPQQPSYRQPLPNNHEQEDPFGDINSQYEISNDDLPF